MPISKCTICGKNYMGNECPYCKNGNSVSIQPIPAERRDVQSGLQKTQSESFKKEANNDGFICEACGAKLEEGQKFCPNCGSKVEEKKNTPRLCSVCGNEIRTGQKFCPNCGNKVASFDALPPATYKNKGEKSYKTLKQ